MIVLQALSAFHGDTEIFFRDTNARQRKKLAKRIMGLIRDGHEVFLIAADNSLTQRVKGYDAERNEWIVYASQAELKLPTQGGGRSKQRTISRVTRQPGKDTQAMVVSKTAGG